jgi:polysaccharide biosynthesis protein PslH
VKILQLSYLSPWPLKDGGAIGIYNLVKAYHHCGQEVTLLFFNTKKNFVEPQKLHAELASICNPIPVYLNTDLTFVGALKQLLINKSYHISRFESAKFTEQLITLLTQNTYDVVHLDGAFMGPYLEVIRKYSKAKVILRTHNVEHLIWERLSKQAGFIKNNYLLHLSNQLKKYELNLWSRVDAIAAITNEDKQLMLQLGCTNKIVLLPAGIDFSNYPSSETNSTSVFFHLGSMAWQPNLEAMQWFLNNVWPSFQARYSNATLQLAGRNLEVLANTNLKGVEKIGEVANAIQFMQQSGIMVVPLQSGSGVRIKIIEAMALGKCIISSSIGAEGIPFANGINLLIADDVETFLQQLTFCITQPQRVKEIGIQARQLALTYFDQNNSMKLFLETIHEI